MDWNIIKAEYISGGTSYRKLAKKYEIEYHSLQRIATKEGWAKLKSQAKAKSETKIVNSIASDIANNSIKLNNVADKLLDKITELIEQNGEILLNTQCLKHITSALKDIKDVKGVKSEADMREQEARIDKLRKDAEAEQGNTSVTVNFNSGIDEYSE